MVKKLLVAYGSLTEAEVPYMAKFDMLDIGFESAYLAGAIKALNPNVKIIGYKDVMAMHLNDEDWAEVNAHEDWFLHDVNGNRLINAQYGFYAMDVGNSGWRAHYANSAKAKLDAYPMVDGIFADDTNEVTMWSWTDFWVNNAVPDPSIAPRWHNDMVGFLVHVKSVIGSKLLIPNTDDLSGDYLRYADGMMMENFVHAPWWTLDYYGWAGFNPLSQVDILARLSATGKYILALDGASNTDPVKTYKVMRYCLACFLLGVNGSNTSFGWNIFSIDSQDVSKGYCPEMDIDVGNPKGAYYQVNPDVYGRDFDHAKVFVNFSDTNTYQVAVDRTLYDLLPRTGTIAPLVAPPLTHTLVVTSTPVIGFAITIDSASYTTPTSPLTLQEGAHAIVAPSNVTVGTNVYNFAQWEDASTNPSRTLNLTADTTITATYQLAPPPPPAKGNLEIHAFLDSQEIVTPYEVTEASITGNTPDTIALDPAPYTVKATLGTETKTQTAQVISGQTVRVDFKFEAPPTPPLSITPVITATAGLILTGMAIS